MSKEDRYRKRVSDRESKTLPWRLAFSLMGADTAEATRMDGGEDRRQTSQLFFWLISAAACLRLQHG